MRELRKIQRPAEALDLATRGLQGSKDRARGAYKYIISQYPGTPAAAEAEALLNQIREGK
jgi:hypothetical protein